MDFVNSVIDLNLRWYQDWVEDDYKKVYRAKMGNSSQEVLISLRLYVGHPTFEYSIDGKVYVALPPISIVNSMVTMVID